MKWLLIGLLWPVQLFAQADVTIRHINVVDVVTGQIKADQLVSIHNGKIASIATDNNKAVKSASTLIDGTNKYLIPGLWDMHSHTGMNNMAFKKDYVIPLMLANGVTGMRIMLGTTYDLQLRDSINNGLLIGPRMVVGTPLLEGPGFIFPWGSLVISDTTRVPIVVDSLRQKGYDFMKVYSFLRSDIFFALARYCNQNKIPFAGHVPVGVTAEEASNAGQRSFEHLFGLLKSYNNDDKTFSAQLEREADTANGTMVHLEILDKSEYATFAFDSIKAKQVIAVLKKNKTAVVPTIAAIRGVSYNQDSLKSLPEMVYADPDHLKGWETRYVTFPQNAVSNALQNLSFLNRQGVMILAGTDNENPYTIHGFTLHEELEWYQQAGLSPLQALQSATLNPAIFLNRLNEMGTVDKNKLADLVILNANPLTDIRNTRNIFAVIMNGNVIDSTQIDGMLRKVREKASEK
jgi:hypothetical protein